MRNLFLTGLLLTTICAATACAEDDEVLPIVVEHYDAVLVVHEHCEARAWEVSRVHFLRGGRQIADRVLCEDMIWSVAEGYFVVSWNDYGKCHRMVTTPELSEAYIELDEQPVADDTPWWGAARRMTDLAQPENTRAP